LEQDGRLDEAFEHYLAVLRYAGHVRHRADWAREHRADAIEALVLVRLAKWAGREGQMADRVRRALQRLDEGPLRVTPLRRHAVVSEYLCRRRAIALQDDATEATLTPNEAFLIWSLSRFLPWEMARFRRLLDLCAVHDLHRVQSVHDVLAAGEALPEESRVAAPKALTEWVQTTFPLPLGMGSVRGIDRMAGICETRRRVARLQLAVAAWRLEHGRLPDSLEELVGTELQSMPVDPFTGLSFQYLPDGAGAAVPNRNAQALDLWTEDDESKDTIAAGTPLLWSAGSDVKYLRRSNSLTISGEPDTQFSHAEFTFKPAHARSAHWITNEHELWSLGWCFPVP
jgi:hypothetical protein